MFCVNSLTGRTTFSFSLERQHALVLLLAPAGLTHTFDSSYLRDPNFRISDRSEPEHEGGNSRPGIGTRLLQDTLLRDQSETPRKCLNQGRSDVPAPAALVTAAPEPHGGGGREGAVLWGGDSTEPLEQPRQRGSGR